MSNSKPNATERPSPNYPRNCWWVAARSEEVVEKPFRRWLLDTPVALYRLPDGKPAALDDRCPHRWAPLSDGWLDGEALVCPYHGARFEADGRCSAFPNQTVPSRMRVRSFAVVERGPFIWIWMGEDAAREAAPMPPAFEWSQLPGATVVTGGYDFDANYLLMHENLLDLTHFNYLHRNTFGIEDQRPFSYFEDGARVGTRQFTKAEDLDPGARKFFKLDDEYGLSEESEGWFESPAWHCLTATTRRKPGGPLPEQAINYVNHLLTPEHMGRTHYWWYFGFVPGLPPEAAAVLGEIIPKAFGEDRDMLVSIQATIDQDPRHRDYPELSFRGDEGGVRMRRIVERLLKAETAEQPVAPATAATSA